MEIGKRLATAGAITATLALAGVVGTSSASAIPPKGMTVPGMAAAPAPEPAPAVPTFVNGMSQPVFSASSADWVTGEIWVESNFDSDGDGKLDRMHTNFTIPKETQTDGLKVPVIYEDSPYFAGTGGAKNWSVDHELGALGERGVQAFFNGSNTSPNISSEFESPWLLARLRRRALRVAGHGLLRRLPDLRRDQRDAGRDRRHRLAQRPSQGLHDPHRHRRGAARHLAQRQDRR